MSERIICIPPSLSAYMGRQLVLGCADDEEIKLMRLYLQIWCEEGAKGEGMITAGDDKFYTLESFYGNIILGQKASYRDCVSDYYASYFNDSSFKEAKK